VPAGGPASVRRGKNGLVPGLAEAVADPSATDLRAHGRVFFTIPEGSEAGDYVCSGTAVNSRNRSLVLTAGHCAFELTGGGFVTHWTFVPAYDAGVGPFGEWPAKRLAVPKAYEVSENLHYDLGAAVVRQNATGQRLQDVVGARGIGFDQPRDQLYDAYGYPAEAPFTGEQEYRCESDNAGSDQTVGSGPATMAIDCNMTGGSSGGGWIAGTTLLSVTSYGYESDPLHLYGPYLSRGAKKLYRSASGKHRKKKHHHGHKHGHKKPLHGRS
jgi:V8-like Glu-specific endopeptidase